MMATIIESRRQMRAALAPTDTLTYRICPACKGKGTVTKTYDDYGMADPKDVSCYTCDGSGRVLPAPRNA